MTSNTSAQVSRFFQTNTVDIMQERSSMNKGVYFGQSKMSQSALQ